jgi:subtilisin family serine protease
MKNIFLSVGFLTMALISMLYGGAQTTSPTPVTHQYRAGALIVKYKSSAGISLPTIIIDSTGNIRTGIKSLDQIHRNIAARSIQKTILCQPNDPDMRERLGTERIFTIRVPESSDIEELAKIYSTDPNVESATPDWVVNPAVAPNDPLYSKQWGHNNTAQMPGFDWTLKKHTGTTVGTVGFDANAQTAWDHSQVFGDSNIVIAIIDNGIEWSHPDLAANIWTNPGETGLDNQGADKRSNGIDDDGNGFIDDWHGWDFGGLDNDPNVVSTGTAHGTACAGIAAAVANNSIGVAGIAGGCRILPIKAASNTDTMYYSYITNSIYYAANMGARIISLSVGTTIQDDVNQAACTYAWNRGSLVCAATGNENNSIIYYPAANTNVLAVGSASNCGDRKRSSSSSTDVSPGVYTDPNGYTCDGERWWGSNYGPATKGTADAVDVVGPTILPTTDRTGSAGYDASDYYLYFNGTSSSTPYVAGICALIASQHPTWPPKLIWNQLCASALDIINVESAAGWDRYTGSGMIDAAAATGTVLIDITPPVLSGINLDYISEDSATISWTTDELSYSRIEYGLTSSYGSSIIDTALVIHHAMTITGLLSDTVYHYRVISIDTSGSPAASSDCSFHTAGIYSYPPTSVTLIADTITSGTVANLLANDGSYLVVKSVTTGTRVIDWYGNTTISQSAADIASLTVTYDGKYNATRTQFLYLFRWADSSWVQIDSARMTTAQVTRIITQTSPAPFISSNGAICLRVYSSATVNITCSADYMLFTIQTKGRSISTDVKSIPDDLHPNNFTLESNFPNPFNPSTTIRYELQKPADVIITIYNILGQEIETLIDSRQQPGIHSAIFDGSSLSSGIYFCRCCVRTSTDELTIQTIKMMLLR